MASLNKCSWIGQPSQGVGSEHTLRQRLSALENDLHRVSSAKAQLKEAAEQVISEFGNF